ncbi:MAG: hypothetical protein ACFE9I_04475 [Candidatus Hermodarchaeota archaeon]
MRKTKILSLLIFSALLIGIIGVAVGYQEYIYRWVNNGAGGTHGACHDSTKTKSSVNGTLVLSINVTGDLSPLQHFTLEVDVLNFTEANLDPYAGRFTLGVPGYRGDNALFTSSVAHQTLNRGEQVDSYGSYDPSDNDNKFDLIAPNKAGTYDLYAVAIAGMNQTDASFYNLTYVEDSIEITVTGSTGTGAETISGGILTIVIGSSVAVTSVLILTVRKRMKKKEL